MRRKEEKVPGLALILLAASLSVVPLAGIPAGTGNSPAKGNVILADGPTPRPPTPPLLQPRPTVS